MTDLKKTIQELKEVIKDLKTQADKGTAWASEDKANLEKRLSHLNDKSQPHPSNLTESLKFDIQDLDNLEALIGADKTTWATEKSKLEKEKKEAEAAKIQAQKDKTAEVEKHNQTKQEIADKLNTDLISGLQNIIKTGGIKYKKPKKKADGTDETDANGNVIYEDATLDFDTSKLEAIKTVIEEIKTKGVQTDLSNLDNKFNDIEEEVKKNSSSDNTAKYCAIGGLVLGVINIFLLTFLIFKSQTPHHDRAKEEVE